MSRWQLIAFGLAVYALALLATAPATLLDARLQQASAGGLRLAGASGTIWSGKGQIEILDSSRRNGVAKSVAWRFRPAHLLRARLLYEIALEDTRQYFPVTVSPSHIDLTNADINLPAAALGLGAPKLAPLGLSGELRLRVARLSIARGSIRGNATLQWHGAGSTYARVSPLGDYELHLEGDGATLKVSLRTLQGPLQLDGEGSWNIGRNPVFRGSARVPPQHQQQLAPLLRMISIERGAGRFDLQLN